ncbi:unnamed protein product [Cuscuta europaea]|uniref:ATP-dependent DNA helicase n=1 Tax=Cuscuta europaea TaxID=41803 RepID=A0A9P0ZT57_CUSEU|nr:unnamed protein product [Cuscuta europaea]
MCLQSSKDTTNIKEIQDFSKWMLEAGDGKISEPNDGYATIQIPNEFLITDYDDPIHGIVESTYPNILQQFKNKEYLKSRAILASTSEIVDDINEYILSLLPGEDDFVD